MPDQNAANLTPDNPETSPSEPNAVPFEVPPSSGDPPPRPSTAGRLLRLIYNHNPFYLLSVCFVLHGTRFWLHDGAKIHAAWQFMALICGFILLLDVTAFVIVRFGKVWDDARTILLTLLFLFVTLALTFDQTLLTNPVLGQGLLIGGFLFCSLVTEGLLLGLGIRLPALFRGPYYLMLGLLFLYPVGLQPGATTDAAALSWRIWLFSPLAALAMLTLVPAIRRGRSYVASNGTPWKWPLFPWCVFLFLILGLGYRAYALSLSFDPVMSLDFDSAWNLETAFQLWFLAPMVVAAGVLLLEVGRVEMMPIVRGLALCLPAVAVATSFPALGRSVPHDEFLAMFRAEAGSPVFGTLLLATLVYAYAFARKVRHAQECFAAALLGFCVIGIDTISADSLAPLVTWPMWTVAGFQLVMGYKQRRSARVMFGLMCAATAVSCGVAAQWSPAAGDAAWLALLEASMIVVGWKGRDLFARMMRPLSAFALVGCAFRLMAQPDQFEPWLPIFAAPLAVMATGALAIWFSHHMRSFMWWLLGWFLGLFGALTGSIIGYANLKRYEGPLNVDSLVFGAAFFLLAILISAYKGGLLQKMVTLVPGPPETE